MSRLSAWPLIALMAGVANLTLGWKLHLAHTRIAALEGQVQPSSPAVEPAIPSDGATSAGSRDSVAAPDSDAPADAVAVPAATPPPARSNDDPDYREATRSSVRLQVMQQSPGLAGELGLNPEEANRLFDVLTSARLRNTRAASTDDPAPVEEQLSRLLGAERYETYLEYQRARRERQSVRKVEDVLSALGHQPLSAAQKRWLMSMMAAERDRRPDAELVQYATNLNTDDPASIKAFREARQRAEMEGVERLINAAAATLDQEQAAVLRDVLEDPFRVELMRSRLRNQ